MNARHFAVWLPAVFVVIAPTLEARASGPKAVRAQPESRRAASGVSDRFGIQAYSLIRQDRVLRVDLLRNDRRLQGTYTLDETKAPYEREERITLGATTFVSVFHDDGEQIYVVARDNQEEARISLDKGAKEWTGDTEAAVRIAKRHVDAIDLIEALQRDLAITPSAPGNPAHWSKKRQGSIGARPSCGTSSAAARAQSQVTPSATGPIWRCSDDYTCTGWGYDFRKAKACMLATYDSASCCWNAECVGCCSHLPCDCICPLQISGDFFCYCLDDGAPCTDEIETN